MNSAMKTKLENVVAIIELIDEKQLKTHFKKTKESMSETRTYWFREPAGNHRVIVDMSCPREITLFNGAKSFMTAGVSVAAWRRLEAMSEPRRVAKQRNRFSENLVQKHFG